MKINFAVQQIVNPALASRYSDAKYVVKQVVGIDVSTIKAARTGVRGGNDIVWGGRAANYAAKLTDLDLAQRTWITEAVYNRLNDAAKLGGESKENMWKKFRWSQHGDMTIYGSTWTWRV